MSTPQPVIRATNLTKRFGPVTAVDGIDFTVEADSVTALLGANGAGKTTTIAMVLGLLLPSAGTITVFGIDISRQRHLALARMNFSSPYIDLPQRLSVTQNLTVYARLYGIRAIDRRLEELATDLQLAPLMGRAYGSLSAGQKTRVMLAKALLNRPDCLLLDEPTASLDPDSADWVRGYLADYQRRTGASLLLASHNMGEVERLCDTVLMMRQGQIIDRGAPADLIARYGRDTLEEVFLDIARARRTSAQQPDKVA